MCNAGCKVTFRKWGIHVEVRYREKVSTKGNKSKTNGLWYVPIKQLSKVNPSQEQNQVERPPTSPQKRN